MELKSKPVRGEIVDGGVLCPLLRSDDGIQIALQGVDKQRYPAGTKLLLEGRFVRVSKCRQGAKTLQVEQVLEVEIPR